MRTTIFPLLLFLMCQTAFAKSQSNINIAWQNLSAIPQALSGHMSAWYKGELLVIGGTDWKDGNKSTFANVWAYSPKRQSWQQKDSLPWPIAYGVAKSTFTGLTIYGGWDDGQTLQAAYSLSKNSRWQQSGDLPLPLAYAAAEVIDNRVYLLGGAADLADTKSYNSFLWKKDTDSWIKISSLPKPCALLASASTQHGVYIFGGMNMQKDKVHNLADAWFYNVTKNKWKALRPLPIAARGMAACAISERYILLAGGYSDTFLNQVLLYDIQKNSYSQLAALPYAASGIQMLYANNRVYVIGGEDAPRQRSDSFFVGRVENLQ